MRAAAAVLFILLVPALAFGESEAAKRFKKDLGAAGADEDKQVEAVTKGAKADDGDAAVAILHVVANDAIAWKVRDAALTGLKTLTAEPARAAIVNEIVKGGDPKVRALACVVARGFGDDGALKALVPALKDKEWPVQAAAVEGLAQIKKKETIDALVDAYKASPMPRVAGDLQKALESLTGEKTPRSGAEWASWWATTREKFSFDAKPADGDAGGAPKTQVRTTPDGSGLYETISSNHVVFVVDVSGSMKTRSNTAEGENLSRLEYVQRELCAAIEAQLGKKTSFNIISFSDGVVPWRKKLVEASPAERKAAKEFVKRLEPKGETDAFDALEAAFADRTVDTIYFLTDGFPTTCSCKDQKHANTNEILGEVRKWNSTRHVKLHCIAFLAGDGAKFNIVEDKGMSRDFMKRLAEENGGSYKVFE